MSELLRGDMRMNDGKTWHTRAHNARPTIGFLVEGVTGLSGYQSVIWAGITDASYEQGANLLCFTGGRLGFYPLNEFEVWRNLVYDLVNADNVDGLIISGGSLSSYVSMEEFETFYSRYRPIPMVSVGLALEGIPSVLVDNEKGLRDAIGHLIQVHGYRRIAFIRGPGDNQEANLRYRAYTEALAEHGLALDPDLVAPGNFLHSSGAEAIHLLPQEGFEAIVAANDSMALGAMQVLRKRGVQVPYDVAIVGFDDLGEAQVVTPSLTTVRQPTYEQGKRAVEMVLALLTGQEVPEQVIFPTELVVRQSCGCYSQAVLQAVAVPMARGEEFKERSVDEKFEVAFTAQREEILSEMAQAVALHSGEAASMTISEWAEQLLDSFVVEMRDQSSDDFLPTLDKVLRQVAAAGGDIGVWQGTLSVLRRHALPCLSDDERLSRAEDLWQQARLFIGEMVQQVRGYRELQARLQAQLLHGIGQALITTFDVEEFVDVMAQELLRLGIPSSYLALYEGRERPFVESRLIVAYDESGRIELEPGGQVFLSRQLLPDGMLRQDRCYIMVVESLYFRNDPLGFALFEVGPRDGTVYEVLQGHISSALEGILILQERQYAVLEVQQRLREQTMLFDASHRLASAPMQAKEIGEIAVRLLTEVMEATECSFSLLDPQTGALQVLADFWLDVDDDDSGWDEADESFNLLDYPLTARVVETHQPLVIQASDPDVDPAELVYIQKNKTATLAIFPLTVKGQTIGVMELETREERHYTPEQISIAMTLANQVAVALENARLYDLTQQELAERKRAEEALEKAYAEVEKQVQERTAELRQETAARERLQQEVIEAQSQALRELSTPIIPVMDRIIVMPLIGSIDSMRARDIMRSLLTGVRAHRAKLVILDITGVPVVDSGVVAHLNKTIQAARLKGARTIITGVSDAVAETVVDLGIDWSGVQTLRDLQTGLIVALDSLGIKLTK
jgi:DNA-binding LacI/PurR family transcriptional regulator/anti-anti-sigma regulatory factor/GAF domain-containing protein